MVSLFRHLEIRNRKAISPPALPNRRKAATQIIRQALHAGQKALDEHDAKQLLATYGISIPLEKRVESENDAVTAAVEIGFPVAVKACSPDILHKTGKGLIALNVRTPAAVREVFRGIRQAGGKVPVLVEEMVKGNRELMAGMTRFPGFGPCVLFGLGGVLTEALRDTTFRCAPLSDTEADEMLNDTRSRDILGPFRGMPAARRSSLVKLLQTVSFIPILHPEITEIDLNPIILDGSKPIVADALITLA
jgi:acyl-CoA synthetase (NDP forming)